MTYTYPTRIDICDGKYTIIYDFETGQSECLHYGKKWRNLHGDKMILAMFDTIVKLREQIKELSKIESPHPLDGLHINKGSFDTLADLYETEYNEWKRKD